MIERRANSSLMRSAIVLAFAVSACGESLATEPAIAGECNYTEADLHGSWWMPFATDGHLINDLIPENDGREIAFYPAQDGVRQSSEWLHHRPFGDHEWSFDNCIVTITSDNGFEELFRLEGAANPVLVQTDQAGDIKATYEKIAETTAEQ